MDVSIFITRVNRPVDLYHESRWTDVDLYHEGKWTDVDLYHKSKRTSSSSLLLSSLQLSDTQVYDP